MHRDTHSFIMLLCLLIVPARPISDTHVTVANISLPGQCLFGSRFLCALVLDDISEYGSRSAIIKRSQSFMVRLPLEPGPPGRVNSDGGMDSRGNVNRNRITSLLHRIRLSKSEDVSNFTFVVIGSSMTMGRGVGGKMNAWPYLLQLEMNKFFAGNGGICPNVTVINRAEGGSTSIWALASLNALLSDVPSIDLVIIDYDITDCSLIQDSVFDRMYVMASTELLIRRLLKKNKKTAIIFMNVAVSHTGSRLQEECKIHNTCYSMGEIRLPVLRAYGCPIVSQKLAIWEHFSCPLANHWPCSRFCSHPLQAAHNLMADLVYAFLINSSMQSISDLFLCPRINDASNLGAISNDSELLLDGPYLFEETTSLHKQICDSPMVAIDAQGPDVVVTMNNDHNIGYTADLFNRYSLNLIRFSRLYGDYTKDGRSKHYSQLSLVNAHLGLNFSYNTCWLYEEDVKGKAGLIANNCWKERSIISSKLSVIPNCLRDSIIVPVTYGSFPRLTLTFLSTYAQNTGCIRVSTVRITNNTFVERSLHRLSQASNATSPLLKEDILASLPWEEINWLDAKRQSAETMNLSITFVHSFIPEPTHYTARNFQYGELTDPQLLLPHHSYLVKVMQIDANGEKISPTNEKQGRGGFRSSPQKFKLYSVSSC